MELLQQQLETMYSACEYTQKLYNGVIQGAECFREGEDLKGYEWVKNITTGMDWLLKVIGLTQSVQNRPIQIEEIKDTIAEMIEAMENEDTILLADLLEYEIKEKLENWYEVLSSSYNEKING